MVMTYKHPNNIPLFYKRGVQSGIYTWSTNTLLLLAKLPACPPCRFMLWQRNMEESQGRQYALVASGNPTATFPIPLYLIMLNPIIITKRTVFGIIVRIEEIEYPFSDAASEERMVNMQLPEPESPFQHHKSGYKVVYTDSPISEHCSYPFLHHDYQRSQQKEFWFPQIFWSISPILS